MSVLSLLLLARLVMIVLDYADVAIGAYVYSKSVGYRLDTVWKQAFHGVVVAVFVGSLVGVTGWV